MKAVGIIGGMGPAATLDFVARVRAATGAGHDQDHLRLLIDDNPTLPNRNLAIAGQGPSPGPALAAMARGLERSGADFLVMPCNTAHAFQAEIEAAVNIPFVSIVEETVIRVPPGAVSAGLLVADGCREAGLYQRALEAAEVEPVLLGARDQALFMSLVYRIKAGDLGEEVRSAMRALADSLSAEVMIAACTEVPLVFDGPGLLNSTQILAERTVALATQ